MTFYDLLIEEIKAPKGKGIIVFDIDDTIINAKGLRIRTKDGEKEYTPTEFAALSEKEKDQEFDFSDFRDANKLFASIIGGTPITKNLRVLDKHIAAGWDVGFLTARGQEQANKKAIIQWLKVRNELNDELKPINPKKIKFFAAVNDPKRKEETKGMNTKEAKKHYLKTLTDQYDSVKFIDDDPSFLSAAKEVLPAKNVIRAQTL